MGKPSDQYSEAETVRRREDALKRMLATPHKPHADSARPRKKKAAKTQRKKPSVEKR